jgi:hypothetical protein
MRSGAMELGDDVGNGITDAGDLSQSVLGNNAIKRLTDRG